MGEAFSWKPTYGFWAGDSGFCKWTGGEGLPSGTSLPPGGVLGLQAKAWLEEARVGSPTMQRGHGTLIA